MESPADPITLYDLFASLRAAGFPEGDDRQALIKALLPGIYDLATKREAMLGPEDEVSDLLHAGLVAVLQYLPTCAETTPDGFVEGVLLTAEAGIQEALEAMVADPRREEPAASAPGEASTATMQDWIAQLGQGRQPKDMPEISPGPVLPPPDVPPADES